MDSGSPAGNLNAYSSGNIGDGGSTPSFSLSTPYAFGTILDGTNGHIYLNNVEQTPATAFTSSLLGGTNCFAIGLQQQSCGTLSSSAADATVAEVVVTNNAISSANRTLLETHFVSKGL